MNDRKRVKVITLLFCFALIFMFGLSVVFKNSIIYAETYDRYDILNNKVAAQTLADEETDDSSDFVVGQMSDDNVTDQNAVFDEKESAEDSNGQGLKGENGSESGQAIRDAENTKKANDGSDPGMSDSKIDPHEPANDETSAVIENRGSDGSSSEVYTNGSDADEIKKDPNELLKDDDTETSSKDIEGKESLEKEDESADPEEASTESVEDAEKSAEEESSTDSLHTALKKAKVSTQAKAANTVSRKIGYINVQGLRLRSGPGTNYASITELSYVNVVILGEKYDNNRNLWYQIAYGQYTGYVISGQNGVKYITGIKYVSVNTDGLGEFPKEYQDALVNILATNPNYTFSAEKIEYTLQDAAKWHTSVKTSGGAQANYDTVLKYMDPATYLTVNGIYAFAEQYYNDTQTIKGLTNMLSVNNAFLNTDGYKKALVEAGKQTGVSPYVLAATILVEKGWHADKENPDVYGRDVWTGKVTENSVNVRSGPGTNYGVIGTISKENIYIVSDKKDSSGNKWYLIIYKGHSGYISASYVNNVKYDKKYYNLFSVNQTDNDPVVGGIYYAMNAGWTSPEKSLIGGAKFYSQSYINKAQDTYYYKDFNVNHPKSNWWHEYASSVTDVISSASILSMAYANDRSAKLNFRIPIYKAASSTTSNNTNKTASSVKSIKGDVNGDGKVSAADYVAIKNHIMGTKTISKDAQKAADVNGDGKISSLDYIAVKNIIMKK